MDNNVKFAFVELNGSYPALQVDFDEDLFKQLIKDYFWIELTKETKDNIQHFIFPPYDGVIRCIKWNE